MAYLACPSCGVSVDRLPHAPCSHLISCGVSRRDDVTVVRPAGELDLATVGVLDDRLHELAAEGATALVVDLSGLTFIDSTGIKLLLGWQRLAIELGLSFELVPGRDAVRRTLAISGADTLLRFRDAPALETPLQT